MAVPRLAEARCFLHLDPRRLGDRLAEAATITGAATLGVPVAPRDLPHIDLVVAGSVAVNLRGARVGKGGGQSSSAIRSAATSARSRNRSTPRNASSRSPGATPKRSPARASDSSARPATHRGPSPRPSATPRRACGTSTRAPIACARRSTPGGGERRGGSGVRRPRAARRWTRRRDHTTGGGSETGRRTPLPPRRSPPPWRSAVRGVDPREISASRAWASLASLARRMSHSDAPGQLASLALFGPLDATRSARWGAGVWVSPTRFTPNPGRRCGMCGHGDAPIFAPLVVGDTHTPAPRRARRVYDCEGESQARGRASGFHVARRSRRAGGVGAARRRARCSGRMKDSRAAWWRRESSGSQ